MKLFGLNKILIASDENNRIILKNALGAFLIKGGALILSLLTMPVYIRYFDNQQILGLWFTILSVLTWILTFDLGIGNGLRNHLVKAFIDKNDILAKKYISSAYFVLGILVLLTSFISIVFFRFVNWNIFLNIPPHIISKEILNITVCIVFSGIMIQFFLKLITSILFAIQKSALINLLSLLSSIIIFAYVSLANFSNVSTNLISLAIIYVLAVNIPLLFTSIIVFSTKLRDCKPSINYFRKKYAREVLMLGGIFFWVQIMYMLITATNEFLITRLTGSEMVVEYQIYNKLFTLIGTVFTLALTPVWSAVTKAVSEKNYAWIKKLYKILKLFVLFAVICQFGMIVILQVIINFWLGEHTIQVNYLYSIVFGILGSMFIWIGAITSLANGFSELKTQVIFMTTGAIIKFPLAWYLVNELNSWIGVIIANILALGLYCIIQPLWLRKFLEKKNSKLINNR